ncbi:unnamed protein product, partial [Ectocarpus sp. 12 AP-2014]
TLAAAAYWAYKGDHDHTPSASPDQFLSEVKKKVVSAKSFFAGSVRRKLFASIG